MDAIAAAYASEDETEGETAPVSVDIPVGGNHLEEFVTRGSHLASQVQLHVLKRKHNKRLVKVEPANPFYFGTRKDVACVRNSFADTFDLTEEGRAKQELQHRNLAANQAVVTWILNCPGQGSCQRECGGVGECVEGVAWEPPTKARKIAQSVKEKISIARTYGTKPFDIVRRTLANVTAANVETVFHDTAYQPTPVRVVDYICNTDKRHQNQEGQWKAVHKIATTCMKEAGVCLLYQLQPSYVLVVAHPVLLRQAQMNQPVLGLDGKHGLQDDGACLMTSVTQHQDGFGCPAAFSIVSRENASTIEATLKALISNVPCSATCDHPSQMEELEGGAYRRWLTCPATEPSYRPFVMIDKHDPSANACIALGLKYLLCWFHIVKAIMEKMKDLHLHLVTQYLVLLGFKIVARSTSNDEAAIRWPMFLQFLGQLPHAREGQGLLLRRYFENEWWCERWRAAWLDLTRIPLTAEGQRTMTTNNLDENLNLKVAGAVGGKRKKISTLVAELTGFRAARENDPTGQPPKCHKASLLDTSAAKLVCHRLGKQLNVPQDIKERNVQAIYIFMQHCVTAADSSAGLYLVKDRSRKERRFKDKSGNWVTLTPEVCRSLDALWGRLTPFDLKRPVPQGSVVVDLKEKTCSCTDFVWRSVLRDACIHIKAAELHRHCERDGSRMQEAKRELADHMRRQMKARPKECRFRLLTSNSDETVYQELKRLHALHGEKLWKILSQRPKSRKTDPKRPQDLPRPEGAVSGRPKLQAAKARPARPFCRQRKLIAGVSVERARPTNPAGLKKKRNCARRATAAVAAKLVKSAKRILTPSPARHSQPVPSAADSAAASETPKSAVCFSRAGRRLVRKRKAQDFVTP